MIKLASRENFRFTDKRLWTGLCLTLPWLALGLLGIIDPHRGFTGLPVLACGIIGLGCTIWAIVRKTHQGLFVLIVFFISFHTILLPLVCVAQHMPRHLPFDAKRWQTADAGTRGKMVDDLVKKEEKLLLGKSKNDILLLLGKPDHSSSDQWEYQVDIGQDFFGSPWFYDLLLHFDDHETVKEVWLMD